jgi:hypothetical protein
MIICISKIFTIKSSFFFLLQIDYVRSFFRSFFNRRIKNEFAWLHVLLRLWTQSALIVLSSFDHYKKGTICGFIYACECMNSTLIYVFIFFFSSLEFLFSSSSSLHSTLQIWKKERRRDLIDKNEMREIKWKKEHTLLLLLKKKKKKLTNK